MLLSSETEQDTDCCETVQEKLKIYPELLTGEITGTTLLHVVSAFTTLGVPSILQNNISHANVNEKDCLGRVPLHYAVLNNNKELVKFLLSVGADPDAEVSSCQINQLTGLLHSPKWSKLLKELPLPNEATAIHIAVNKAQIEIVKLLLEHQANSNSTSFGETTPLMLAVANKNHMAEQITKLLLENGADADLPDSQGRRALTYAVVHGNIKAVEMLLDVGAWLKKDKNGQTPLHEAAKRGAFDVLVLFLKHRDFDNAYLDDCDAFERTPLYWAASSGHVDCFKLLVQHNANMATGGTTSRDTIMEALFSTFPQPVSVLQEIFDSRITMDDTKTGAENPEVVVDFSPLIPFKRERQMEVVEQMLVAAGSNDGAQILQHPLVESFIRLKWGKIVYFFYVQLVTYLLFTATLSAYVFFLVHETYLSSGEVFSFIRYTLFLLSTCLMGHAAIQLFLEMKAPGIISQYELWLYLLCNLFSMVIAVMGPSITKETTKNDIPEWVLHSSSIAVLLSWVELMLLIGRFPTYGYYALMFSAVLQNVIKVLSSFVCLVMGFALSFSIQFVNYEEFTNPWRAVVRTTVMMMGEFEYTSLFSDDGKERRHLSVTSRVMFLFFIILTSIVLLNLMVGLAVNDIQGLQTEGHVRGLEKRKMFLRQLERVVYSPIVKFKYFPSVFRRILKRKCSIDPILRIQPNVYLGKNRYKKLPAELIESIFRLAKRKGTTCELLQDKELRRFLNCLHSILERYNVK